jgi:hypothetical protein
LCVGQAQPKLITFFWRQMGLKQPLELKACVKDKSFSLICFWIESEQLLHRHQSGTVIHVNLPEF